MTTSTTRTMPARLDAASLREWTATTDGPRLLDVRTPAEFTTAHIPGSYNVPLDLLREHRDELREHLDQDVVLICRSGARAGQAEALLAGTGLANLHVLDGGITAWQQAGAPVNQGPARWDLERQVRLVAGSLVLTGVLASILAPQGQVALGGHRRRPDHRRPHQHLRHGQDAVQAALQPRRQHRPADRHRRAHRRPQLLTGTAPGGPGAYAVEAFGRDYVRRGLELGAGQGRNSLAFLRAVTSYRLAGAGAGDVRPDPARARGPAGRRG